MCAISLPPIVRRISYPFSAPWEFLIQLRKNMPSLFTTRLNSKQSRCIRDYNISTAAPSEIRLSDFDNSLHPSVSFSAEGKVFNSPTVIAQILRKVDRSINPQRSTLAFLGGRRGLFHGKYSTWQYLRRLLD